MGHIVCTDAYAVKLLAVKKLLMAGIEMHAVKSAVLVVAGGKFFCLAGDEVSHCNNINIIHCKVALDVGLCNPARTDNTYLKASAC